MENESRRRSWLGRIGWTYLSVEAGALAAFAIVYVIAAILGIIAAVLR